MKKLFTLFTMLSLCIASTWADVQTDFVSVITPIDGSVNLENDIYNRSKTLKSRTVMSFALNGGNLFAMDKCNTEWNNTVAVSELNSILNKKLSASAYFPQNTANRNGQTNRTVTCTANLSNTAGYDASKNVTFYVALYTQSTPTLSVTGFSEEEYQYALANGNGFTKAGSVSAIPCATKDYTLVKITGKLSEGVASVSFYTTNNNRSGVQWMAIQYEKVPTVENTYTYYLLGEQEIAKEIGSFKYEDVIGSAPTGALSLPSYVDFVSTTAPKICGSEPATFKYYTQENEQLPFKTDGTTYYNLALNRNPNLQIYAREGVTDEIQTQNVAHTVHTQYYYMWSFEGDWYKGYAIKNRAADAYVSYGTTANPSDKTKATLVTEKEVGSYFDLTIQGGYNYFSIHGTKNNAYISNNGGATTTFLTNWNDTRNISQSDAGSQVIITEAVEYDLLYFSTEVTGSTQNVNLGTFSYSVNGSSTSVKLKTTDATTPALYRISKNSAATLSLSRTYRGFKFNGFYLGEERLGLNPTLSASQLRTVTSDNPVVAKFTAQGDDVTLFYDDDPKSYRIPAIGTTSTGRLIAISDYRHNLDDIGRDKHGTGTLRIDLVYRTSDDNGQTWSEKKILKEGTDVRGNADCGFGDAAIACGDGKIAVFSVSGSVFYSNTSATSHNCMARFVSTDNGETWEYSDITDKIIGTNGILPGTYGIFFGSGKLAVDKNFNGTGNTRIYGALLTKDSSSSNNNFVVYSDDFGETWKILGQGTDKVANADEPKVEILPNGQILLSSRRSGGRMFNIFTYGSGDTDKANGIGTWGTAANGCPNGGSNATNGEIFLTQAKTAAGTDTYLLLQSQPKGGSGQYDRRDVTVWYKEISSGEIYTVDQIKTGWTQGKQISTQLSSYSTMSLQADGKLAFFFEEAPCYDDNYEKGYCMVYMPLTIESVTNGTYFSADYNPSAQVTVNYTLSDEQGNTYTGTLSNCPIKDIATTLTTQFKIITLGSDIEIVKVEDGVYSYKNTVSLPFKVSNAEGEYWHNIYFPSNTNSYYPVYWSGSSSATTVQTCTEKWPYGESSFNTKANADKISWAIYSNGNTFSFTFRNKLADKYISVEGQTPSEGTKNCDYSETGTAFTITPQGATTYKGDYNVGYGTGYLVAWSATNGYTTYSTNISHPGGWVKIVEAPDFDTEIATANEHLDKFRDMPGYYTPSDAASAAKTAMANADDIKLNTLRSYQTLSSSIVLPVSGKFYRLKGSVSNKYAYSKGAGAQMGMSSTESDYQTAGLFYFNGNNTDGFSILNYKDGYYVYDTHSTGQLGESTKFQFATHTTTHLGTLTIKQIEDIDNHGHWMFDNGNGNKSGNPVVDRNKDYVANNCDWYISEVTSIPVTFNPSALGYATFNSPVALAVPEGVEAYVCKIDGNKIKLFKANQLTTDGLWILPANTPVLLYNKNYETDATKYFTVTSTDEAYDNNDFYGTSASETPDATKYLYYALRKKSGSMGFYQRADQTATLTGFRAWIRIKQAEGARNFVISFDGDSDPTGIAEALGLQDEKVEIYDLNGRKLTGYQKGINIVNGKKVFK